ncbi:NAD-dependent protein deacetylase sirtuin-1 isoform X2 [Zootermopsis nevadensis]|uniref:NAD-dependent protein deacetylase sirtuin-1 isoform X2 n=1 Tax=Zootermopsis nevadensis TaxID=136037 RepID=UPI000B8E65CD|nr:NAD-dependent protein deacetylase sirtuin-1 isoform X2 [Zootermopsis nevadensis]
MCMPFYTISGMEKPGVRRFHNKILTANSTRDDDRDEVSSTVSYLSDISGLSELSGQEWKPMAGPMSWVQRQMIIGVNPRSLLNQLVTDGTQIPQQMDDLTLWKIIMNMMSEPPRRQKLRHINTLVDVVRLLKGANKIIVLTGAGVSVSCGIPDFRSRNGIYSRLAIDFPDLPDPQAMFDIQYFSQDPRPFFKFAREIYPGQFKPSPCHRFIKMLEKHKKLLRNYSQNIDTLEQVAGIQNVIECHGSFATASCTRCKHKVTADEIREDIFAQGIPVCPCCPQVVLPPIHDTENKYESYKDLVSRGIMKPDIVFFGEGLPEVFHESMAKDKDECDLLIVIGSSLKVRPVALIPSSIPPDVPQILINREPLPHFSFDVELLGDSDVIINQICHMMGNKWTEVCWRPNPLIEASHLVPHMGRRRNSLQDSSWEDRNSDPCATDCSRDSVSVQPSHQLSADCSSQDSVVSGRLDDQCSSSVRNSAESRSPFQSGEQMLNIESNEADSLQMSIDSGMGMSAADSSCSAFKERHMSVDSSTHDSGVGFSADSPTDVGSGHLHMLVDSTKDSGKTGITSLSTSNFNNPTSSSSDMFVDSTKDCDLGGSCVDSSTTTTTREPVVLVESSGLPADPVMGCRSSNMVVDSTTDSKNTGVSSTESNCSLVVHRHMSVDSMRDSGIGDGSNSVGSSSGVITKERHMSVDSSDDQPKSDGDLEGLRACWQPKIRESLAARLPENSYYFLAPNRYIFPGAEVYYDPDDNEQSSYSSSSSSSSSDEGDSANNSSAEESDNDVEDGEYWDDLASAVPDRPVNGKCP